MKIEDLPGEIHIGGIYRHYKGNLYQVLHIGDDSNADKLMLGGRIIGERTVVVYIALQTKDARPGPRVKVRTWQDFVAKVDINTGQVHHLVGPDSYPRFNFLGYELEEWMLE